MYRVTLFCDGLPTIAGADAARDIAKEFADHRQWHDRVSCDWNGSRLTLSSVNDFDESGLATKDEFSDCIAAHVSNYEGAKITVASISPV
ncbi:MAG: hypothetical protein JWO95_1653 [Verrucomicrobiales bacterium]|nr:hypothetical protein [Verrucomicrobiales bacterium]